jgi:hypothetical protein
MGYKRLARVMMSLPSENFADVFSSFENGIRLIVKAKPGASRPRAPRLVALADGKRAVEIAVAAIAEDGKANKAIIERLAIETGFKKGDMAIKTGTSGRLKLVEIRGERAVLQAAIIAWLQSLSGNGKSSK